MTTFGLDFAWGRPGVPALRQAGVKFLCRYLSHDTKGKNLTAKEAREMSDAGIWLVVVWETTAKRPLSGRTGGVADARDALKMAQACGMPEGRPIYFAADWDVSADEQATLDAYLKGVSSVIGVSRTGLYGGYRPVKRSFDAGTIKWGWQTYAWSGGKWDVRAQLQQYSNDHRVGGVDCDFNRAMTADYGQWKVGVKPSDPLHPAASAPTFRGRVLIQKDPEMSGEDIRLWQSRMRERGWKITVDGYYGDECDRICRAFQEEKNLPVDGMVGKVTWVASWESPVT